MKRRFCAGAARGLGQESNDETKRRQVNCGLGHATPLIAGNGLTDEHIKEQHTATAMCRPLGSQYDWWQNWWSEDEMCWQRRNLLIQAVSFYEEMTIGLTLPACDDGAGFFDAQGTADAVDFQFVHADRAKAEHKVGNTDCNSVKSCRLNFCRSVCGWMDRYDNSVEIQTARVIAGMATLLSMLAVPGDVKAEAGGERTFELFERDYTARMGLVGVGGDADSDDRPPVGPTALELLFFPVAMARLQPPNLPNSAFKWITRLEDDDTGRVRFDAVSCMLHAACRKIVAAAHIRAGRRGGGDGGAQLPVTESIYLHLFQDITRRLMGGAV